MSASIATREFLLHLKPKGMQETFFPVLLPAMCLNRLGGLMKAILYLFFFCTLMHQGIM